MPYLWQTETLSAQVFCISNRSAYCPPSKPTYTPVIKLLNASTIVYMMGRPMGLRVMRLTM